MHRQPLRSLLHRTGSMGVRPLPGGFPHGPPNLRSPGLAGPHSHRCRICLRTWRVRGARWRSVRIPVCLRSRPRKTRCPIFDNSLCRPHGRTCPRRVSLRRQQPGYRHILWMADSLVQAVAAAAVAARTQATRGRARNAPFFVDHRTSYAACAMHRGRRKMTNGPVRCAPSAMQPTRPRVRCAVRRGRIQSRGRRRSRSRHRD